MYYDTPQRAYAQASAALQEEDKAAVKAIADKALADIAEAEQINNANYDDAVAAAYRHANQQADTNSERYALQANAGNIEHNLRRYQSGVNGRLANLRTANKANEQQIMADIDEKYGNAKMKVDADINAKRKAQDDAILAEREKQKAQEGVMEQLEALSAANGYAYDFDKDIFELKRQGVPTSDWRILFLTEAKRRQTANAKALKTSAKGSGGGKGNSGDGELVSPNSPKDRALPTATDNTDYFTTLKNRIGQYLNTPTGRQNTAGLIERIETEYNSGKISEAQAKELIKTFNL